MTAPEGSDGRSKLDALLRRRRRARALRWLLVLLVLAGGVYLWLRAGSERASAPERPPVADTEEPAPPPPVEEADEPVTPPAPIPSPPPPAPLPTLADSDASVREEASALSGDPRLTVWLGVDSLIERFVLAVVNVSEGASPRKPLAPLVPADPFRVRIEDERITPHPAGYARYDGIAIVFDGLDAEAVAAFYRRFEPLLDEVHAQLASPGEPLRESLGRAAAEVLATPRVQGEPELVFHVNRYLYADPKLENLSSAQKLLLRTGPENVRRIQDKVRAIARALGIPDRQLPKPVPHHVEAS